MELQLYSSLDFNIMALAMPLVMHLLILFQYLTSGSLFAAVHFILPVKSKLL